MSVIKEKLIFTLKYEMSVDTSTGEILETKLLSKKVDTEEATPKKSVEGSPKLVLESNKYVLTDSAMALMGVHPDDKLEIKYESSKELGKVPVIGTVEAFGLKGGNRLSKSNSVSFRGSKNEELTKYGTEFDIIPHPSKDGLFILIGDSTPEIASSKDDNIVVNKSDEDLPLDVDLSALVDEKDSNIEEIDSSYFQL